MASQTKVDSAGRTARERAAERRAAERRAEAAPASQAPDTSASGTFSAGAHEKDEAAAPAESDFAPARASEEDEDVSLDELMMSDSLDEDEEEEATDIHPGLSDAVLAESLRVARVTSRKTEERTPDVAAHARELSAAEDPAADVQLPSSSYSELASSAAHPDLDVAESRAAAEAAQAAAAGEEEPVARAETESAPPAEAPRELEQEESTLQAEARAELEQEEFSAEAIAASLEEGAPEEAASDEDSVPAAAVPESAPVHGEPTRADAAQAEVIEPAPESEAEVLSVNFEPEADEPLGAAELDLDDGLDSAEPVVAAVPSAVERESAPATLAAKRRDGPLPSFDIPDLEALSAATGAGSSSAAANSIAANAAAASARVERRSSVNARSVALPPLSEIAEDDEDDDAVTHMGLPSVPEAANDFPAPGGFQVADAAVAALESLDADIRRGDARRATTRVIPRVDLKSLPVKPRVHAPAGPPLAERLGSLLRGTWARVSRFRPSQDVEEMPELELSPARQRFNWLVENVLPPLSLVLFGSGLGAGVIMLVETRRASDPAQQGQTVQALQDSSARGPLTLVDRARAGDGEALYKITNMPQGERTSGLTLALEVGYQTQKLREFREFSKSLGAGSGTLPAASVSRMVDYATSPETMLPAFQELTQWTGAAGPDVLYAVWEKAAGGSRAASLAQQLLYSADQRAKATPALLVALDLRSAANCDDYLRVLPAVVRHGDQRSSASLRALRHNDGCGADGQQDCYACLRDNSLLEDALKAIDGR